MSEHVSLAAHQSKLYGALQKAYDDLRQTQQAVMQQERLRSLGRMASSIAHDINNAISPVALYTESLLEREPNRSSNARRYLETIQRTIDEVAQTVARMREFYRQRAPQMTLARERPRGAGDRSHARSVERMALQRGVVIEMRTALAPQSPAIMGVESEIREALTNLIFNAVDAMAQRGTLTLRTQVTSRSVSLEVIDAGSAWTRTRSGVVSSRYLRRKASRVGVMQRHCADIEIDSTPGRGTTIRLGFAIPTVSVGSNIPTATPQVPPPLRILLVDDDQVLLKSLEDILRADGHTLTVADGGEAGIQAFPRRARAGRPSKEMTEGQGEQQ